jgi:hypothetical protein
MTTMDLDIHHALYTVTDRVRTGTRLNLYK